jgi:hypothetical protein
MDGVRGRIPMSPARIGTAHFSPAGQHFCVPPVTQHERLLGQQPAAPQHREVRRLQQRSLHCSSFGQQRLQSPVDSLMHFHRGGQHLFLPHHARFDGQRLVQTSRLLVPTRVVRHSSFSRQHSRPQRLWPRLQQRFSARFAQNSPDLQQLIPHGVLQMQLGLPLPPPQE